MDLVVVAAVAVVLAAAVAAVAAVAVVGPVVAVVGPVVAVVASVDDVFACSVSKRCTGSTTKTWNCSGAISLIPQKLNRPASPVRA